MEAKVVEVEKSPSLREMQAEIALNYRKSGWLDCLLWLNERELISVDAVRQAREAMEELK